MDTQGNGEATEQEETAMAPYSMDLRERVAAAVDYQEGSQREIARRFRVSLSFIVRLLQRRREVGTLTPKPHGGGPNPALSLRDQEQLRELIQEQSDATLEQLKQQGGFGCTPTTIWRTLRRFGLTYKKKTLHASERDRPEVQEKRRRYQRKVRRIEPKRLVFVDETGVNTAMTPTHAWAPRGERAGGSVPTSWGTVTVIAALGLGGGASTAGIPRRHRYGGVPNVRRAGAGAGTAGGRRRGV
jgi:transposase